VAAGWRRLLLPGPWPKAVRHPAYGNGLCGGGNGISCTSAAACTSLALAGNTSTGWRSEASAAALLVASCSSGWPNVGLNGGLLKSDEVSEISVPVVDDKGIKNGVTAAGDISICGVATLAWPLAGLVAAYVSAALVTRHFERRRRLAAAQPGSVAGGVAWRGVVTTSAQPGGPRVPAAHAAAIKQSLAILSSYSRCDQ